MNRLIRSLSNDTALADPGGSIANTSSEMIQTNLAPNLTALAMEQGHDPIRQQERMSFFQFKFDHIQHVMTFSLWFFVIIISKIGFQRFERFKGALPDSALLLSMGLLFGGILHFSFPDQEFYLKPDWFFLYFLPPIVLEAGYFLPNREFFQNIGTITTYAVIGTLWNIVATGFTLFIFKANYHILTTATDILLFATLISAVDPVAVICVFEEVHVNNLLYICVFGESLLNDAVTIVLYNTFQEIARVGLAKVFFSDFILAFFAFFGISFGGIIIGAIWAVLIGFVTKWGTGVSVVQPLTCLLFPYLAYLCAEMFGLSGILAIVTCGLIMKQYIIGNISEQSKITVNFFMKTLSSSCEAMIFVFLGLSAVSKNHDFDLAFVIITLVSIFIFRFIGVVILTWILNLRRLQKINFVDQFIMGYGGIRGAVCYGLVMSLSPELVRMKDMFMTTTIIVIFFTVFAQGGSIKSMVKYLKVKQEVEHKKTVFELIADNVTLHIVGGMESIVGHRGNYWLRMMIQRFNDKYIQPFIMVRPQNNAMKILRHNEELQVNEALVYLKQHGSFAGMPTVQSKTSLVAEAQPHQPLIMMNGRTRHGSLHHPDPYQHRDRSVTTRSGKQRRMPRNQSISRFVADTLAESSAQGKRHHRYSRHFMPNDLPMIFLESDDSEGDDIPESDYNNYKTYPYSKASHRDLVATLSRKVSRSSSGPAGSTYQSAESSPQNNPDQPSDDRIPRPTFIISDADEETTDGSSALHLPGTSHQQNRYSIGRFDIGSSGASGSHHHHPTGGNGGSGSAGGILIRRPNGGGNGNSAHSKDPEDSVAILMPPIEEQDEDMVSTTTSPKSTK